MARNRIGVLASLVLGACGGEGKVHVDTTLAQSAALSNASMIGQTLSLPTAAGTLVVERVRIAVSEVELEGAEEGDAEFEMGARVVGVALDGNPTEVVVQSVPADTYQTLGMELHQNSGDFGDPAASILVEGTYDDAPFEYRSSIVPELEFNLPTPAVVRDGGEARIAVTFDVAAWFQDANGTAMDPTDEANRTVIESAIMTSMAAVAEVEEEDGAED